MMPGASTRRMNRRRWIGLVLAITTLTVVGWYGGTWIAILYHKQLIALADRRMHAINGAQMAGESGRGLGDSSKWYARRQYHLGRLVALGYYFHASYRMENLPNTQRMHSGILFSGMKTFPIRPYWMITEVNGCMVIDVYDFPEFKSQWDAFAKQNNDPKFAGRFADERGGYVDAAGVEPAPDANRPNQ
jgi:hypothetical protein